MTDKRPERSGLSNLKPQQKAFKNMYTTLTLIKQMQACKPGYARQLSFFGRAADVQKQKIPLHVIALIGGLEDIKWVTESAMIIDPKEFEAFQRRTLSAVWAKLLHSTIEYSSSKMRELNLAKNSHFKKAVMLGLKTTGYAEILKFIEEQKWQNFDHSFFNSVIRHKIWASPSAYVHWCVMHYNEAISTTSICGNALYNSRNPRTANSTGPTSTMVAIAPPVPRPSRAQRASEIAAVRAAERRRLQALEERDDDSEVEDDEYRGWTGVEADEDEPARKGEKPRTIYCFETHSANASEAQNLANMLSPDPYAFLTTHTYKLPKGVRLEPASVPDEQRKLILNLEDSKDMFAVLKLLTGRTEVPDQL